MGSTASADDTGDHPVLDAHTPPVAPFAAALALAVVVVSTAPVIGILRDRLFQLLGDRTVPVLAAALVGLAGVLGVWSLVQLMRHGGAWRWGGLAMVAALLYVQVVGFSIGIPTSDVAEKIHIAEYGLFAFLLYRGFRRAGAHHLERWVAPVLGAVLLGLADESVQGYFQLRVGDIRDVALDALAGLTGLIFALVVTAGPLKVDATPPPRGAVLRLAALASAAVLGSCLFYAEQHLGYEIHDPSVGRFVSWFDAAELRRLQADRQHQWALDPVDELAPWAPEDYYLTEAAWHANHRNERLRAGDVTSAVYANRMLEAYYAPFLDLESFHGSGKHRWPVELRRRLESEHTVIPDGYVSPVLRDRVRTWPPPAAVRWFGVGLAFLVWWVAAATLRKRARMRDSIDPGSPGPNDVPYSEEAS